MSLSKKITLGLGLIVIATALFAPLQRVVADCTDVKTCLASVYPEGLPKDAFAVARNAVTAFYYILGVVFFVMMLYGGWNWMTAMGDSEKVTKAKDTLVTAIIGLIIVIASYGITAFVINRVYTATAPGATGSGGTGDGGAAAGAR